jgi:hypothetical protein
MRWKFAGFVVELRRRRNSLKVVLPWLSGFIPPNLSQKLIILISVTGQPEATPPKNRLMALLHICVHISRHINQKLLDLRQ